MSSLQDDLDRDYAAAWQPDPGDKLVGTVVDISERDGAFGRYPIVTLSTEDGELAIHAFHDVLANELARIAPKVGDELGVKYAGKHPDKGYHQYRVRRAGASADVDWSRYGDDPAEDLRVGVPLEERNDDATPL